MAGPIHAAGLRHEPSNEECADAVMACVEDGGFAYEAVRAWQAVPDTLVVLRAMRVHVAGDFQLCADLDAAIRELEAIR